MREIAVPTITIIFQEPRPRSSCTTIEQQIGERHLPDRGMNRRAGA